MPKTTILLTGARAPATLDLLRHLAAGGHRVLTADAVPFALAAASRYTTRSWRLPAPVTDFKGFEKKMQYIVEQERVDLVIPACEEIFWVAQTRLAAPVFAPPTAVLMQLHDKYRFNQLLHTLALPAPHTVRLADDAEALPFAPAVVKPVYSRFGTHVQIVRSADRRPGGWGRGMLCQELIDGQHWASYGIAVAGQLRAFAAYRLQWRYGATGAATFFMAEPCPAMEEQVRRIAAHLQCTGQLAFDCIERDGRWYAIECNPRLTSGIHLFAQTDELAAAFAPGHTTIYPGGPPRKLALPMLLAGQMAGFDAPFWADWQRATDVVWSWRDPLPALAQAGLMAHWAWQARRRGIPLVSATTVDIEWNPVRVLT